MQIIKHNLGVLEGEYHELETEFETYEYQGYEELIEEIQSIKLSNEYNQNAAKDPNHYLRVKVKEMEAKAPRLKRYERLQAIMKK